MQYVISCWNIIKISWIFIWFYFSPFPFWYVFSITKYNQHDSSLWRFSLAPRQAFPSFREDFILNHPSCRMTPSPTIRCWLHWSSQEIILFCMISSVKLFKIKLDKKTSKLKKIQCKHKHKHLEPEPFLLVPIFLEIKSFLTWGW